MQVNELWRQALAALANERGQVVNAPSPQTGQPASGPATGQGAPAPGAGGTGDGGAPAGQAPAGQAPTGQPGSWEDVARLYPEIHKKFGADPVKMAQSVAEAERILGRYSGELGLSPEEAFYALQGFIRQQQEAAEGGGEDTGEVTETAEQLEAKRQAFVKDLAADPEGAIKRLIAAEAKSIVDKSLAPMSKATATLQASVMWDAAAKAHPDIMEYHDTMVELLNQNPALAQLENPMEGLYWLALFHPRHREATINKIRTQGRDALLTQVREGTVEPGSGGGAPPTRAATEQEKVVKDILNAGAARPKLTPLS